MKQNILDYIDEIVQDEDVQITEDEFILLNIIRFAVEKGNMDNDVLEEIGDSLDYYDNGDENEEEEVDIVGDDIDENEDDIAAQLIEKIVKKVRGGKIVKIKKGYRGGKKIKPSTLMKQKRAAKKRARRPVKSSTKLKRKKSLRKTLRKGNLRRQIQKSRAASRK